MVRRVTPRVRSRTATRASARRHSNARIASRAARSAAASRLRHSRTLTKTMVKRKSNTVRSAQSHYSMSSVNYGTRPLNTIARYGKEAPRNSVFQNTGGFISTGIAGYMGVSDAATTLQLFTLNDVTDIFNQVYDQTQFLVRNDTQSDNLGFVIHKAHAEITLKNDTNEMNVVRVYDLIARHDLNRTDSGTDAFMYPHTMWQEGISQIARTGGISDGDTVTYRRLGDTPFNSPQFTHFFKVAKVTKVIMDPGSIHNHSVRFAPNKYWNNRNLSSTSFGWKGLSVFTMIVAEGSPIAAATGGINGVTSSEVKMAVNIKKTYTYSVQMLPAPRVAHYDNLAAGAPTAGQLIDAETGVKEAFTKV